jgi:hypothetical protein
MHDDHADVTIVVGLDGSPSSKRAFAFALGTAQRSGGRVVAAYVARLTSPAMSIGMAIGAANGFLPSVDSAAKPIVDEIRSHVEAACGEDGIDAVFCSLPLLSSSRRASVAGVHLERWYRRWTCPAIAACSAPRDSHTPPALR